MQNDTLLNELVEMAIDTVAVHGAPKAQIARGLAQLVADRLGGAAHDDVGLQEKWLRTSHHLKTDLKTEVLPLGQLEVRAPLLLLARRFPRLLCFSGLRPLKAAIHQLLLQDAQRLTSTTRLAPSPAPFLRWGWRGTARCSSRRAAPATSDHFFMSPFCIHTRF